jgi:hypothetical protein
MPLEIIKVETAKEKKQFIKLPWKIYQDYPLWVPPLISERLNFFDTKKNPFFIDAEVVLYLLLSEKSEPVGRIAVIKNNIYNKFHNEETGFFGMFECIDDQEAANLLLDTAHEWCQSRGLKKLLGPMNLSTNHECGLLIDGFDTPPVMGITYNPPYYTKLFHEWGLEKAKDLVSLLLEIAKVPAFLPKVAEKICKRGRFTLRPLNMKNFDSELEVFWNVYNSAWIRNWGFIPLSRKEFIFLANDLKHIIQPGICMMAEVKGEPVAFSLAVPNINETLKKLNGRLFPTGFIKFILNKNKAKIYRVMTLGVKKEYMNRGIDTVLYAELYKSFIKNNVKYCDISWVLEDNKAMLKPMLRLGATTYKKHRIYERAISN